ncbi:MAG: DUF695 domain-containing protein [Capnocytophaga sp.]|nr:DUF695 domain-containing protein [Capnocytophaga sp.]
MTNLIEPNWNVYRGYLEEIPAIIRLNLALDRVAPIANFSHCVKISVALKNPDEQGFSTNEEREKIYQIEDDLVSFLDNEKNIFVAVITFKGSVTWYFYSQNASELEEKAREKCSKNQDYPCQIEINEDKNWELFLKGIYPNLYEMQAIYNRSVIHNCEQYGDLVDRERPIEHWLYFDTETDMQKAIEKAKAIDYAVEYNEKIEPEEGEETQENLGYRLVLSKANTPLDIDTDTWDLIDIALDTNGTYDGWETPIVKE